MWEYIKEKEGDTEWLKDALINGMLVGVMDGSYDRHKAKSCSGSGWILVCTASKRTLRGSFYEVSVVVAGAYRSKLLGLVALHTLILALADYYNIQSVSGKICCDNIAALNQASKTGKQVRSGSSTQTYREQYAHISARSPWHSNINMSKLTRTISNHGQC